MYQERQNECLEVRPIKEIRRETSRFRSIEIALFVADQETVADIYRVPLKQSIDHSRLRLAAAAEDSVSRNLSIGVVWAKFESIDMRANDSELMRHPFMQISNMPLLVETPSDS